MSKPILYRTRPEFMITAVIESSHCMLDLLPGLCSWEVQCISADMEHWWWAGGRCDIQVCWKSHHLCFDVYCSSFSVMTWLLCPGLRVHLLASLLCFLFPWWYKQFIKMVLKEILRCVTSDVGHLLYSAFPNGTYITSISSCKLETLHIILVFRYTISFSPWICAQGDLAQNSVISSITLLGLSVSPFPIPRTLDWYSSWSKLSNGVSCSDLAVKFLWLWFG